MIKNNINISASISQYEQIFIIIINYDDGILKLEILNYGSEVYIYGFDEKTVVKFSEELEKVYGIKEVNVYIDENSEEDNDHHSHDHDHDHSCGCDSHDDHDGSCGCGESCNN